MLKGGPVRTSHLASTGTDQTPILVIVIVLGCQDVGATLAFLQRSDITDEVIDAYSISILIEPPNGDAFTGSHSYANGGG
jgi:hypothetical protein